MSRSKGILYAVVSSSTFGLAPFFTLSLLSRGYSTFEVLSYRWGVATICLLLFGLLSGCHFHLGKKDFGIVFVLSLFRAATSLSLVIAYRNIASGVASTIHFMYPLAVALAMIFFYHERKSSWTISAIVVSIAGAILLSTGSTVSEHGNLPLGLLCACFSIFSYGGYIIGVRKSRAVTIDSIVLTCYVMGWGALFFIGGSIFTGGLRLETDGQTWLYILGLALPTTALSNISLVQAIKYIGPTLTSIFGAMEPLTAVIIGILIFHEPFTLSGALGVISIIAAVLVVIVKGNSKPTSSA